MSELSPSDPEIKKERLESYKKVWRVFLWLGWPAALLVMWLGGRIIDGLHGRVVELQTENERLKAAHETPAQK